MNTLDLISTSEKKTSQTKSNKIKTKTPKTPKTQDFQQFLWLVIVLIDPEFDGRILTGTYEIMKQRHNSEK